MLFLGILYCNFLLQILSNMVQNVSVI